MKLAAGASTIVVAKRGSVVTFVMTKDPPADEALLAHMLAHMLGPTGNLRAPTIKKGKTLLVGFDEESYEKLL